MCRSLYTLNFILHMFSVNTQFYSVLFCTICFWKRLHWSDIIWGYIICEYANMCRCCSGNRRQILFLSQEFSSIGRSPTTFQKVLDVQRAWSTFALFNLFIYEMILLEIKRSFYLLKDQSQYYINPQVVHHWNVSCLRLYIYFTIWTL